MNPDKRLLPAVLIVLLAIAPAAWPQADGLNVEVVPGDTLFGLVRLHYPDAPSRWSLIENEVFAANPKAFAGGDKSRLRVGAMLRMPVYEPPESSLTQANPEPVRRPLDLATVGTIIEISGTPLAIDINNQQRLLALGGDVFRGDAIVTEGDSAAHLEMNDGAQLYVRSDSRLVIDEYSFLDDNPQFSRSIMTLLKGGFRAITGLIGRRSPASVRINTAIATIGVRGTDFAVRICGLGECSLPEYGVFEAGDYSGVIGGQITLTNDVGTTAVAVGEIMRTASADSAPVPAPEAAALVFSESELALLRPEVQRPMNFFQWLRSLFSRRSSD